MLRQARVGCTILGCVLLSSVGHAAATDSVSLVGTVPPSVAVTTTSTASASRLDLTMPGQVIVHVSEIPLSTNSEQGLTLTVTSGSLTEAGGTSIAYQVAGVAHGATPPLPADFTPYAGETYTMRTSAAGRTDMDLYIMYTAPALQEAGAYAGWITLTVSDN